MSDNYFHSLIPSANADFLNYERGSLERSLYSVFRFEEERDTELRERVQDDYRRIRELANLCRREAQLLAHLYFRPGRNTLADCRLCLKTGPRETHETIDGLINKGFGALLGPITILKASGSANQAIDGRHESR